MKHVHIFFIWSPFSKWGAPNKKVEPINCIIKCNLSTPLGPSLMPLHQWFSYLIYRSNIDDTSPEPNKSRFKLDLARFQYKECCILLYYATKSVLCQAGWKNLRCGTFSAPHRFIHFNLVCTNVYGFLLLLLVPRLK